VITKKFAIPDTADLDRLEQSKIPDEIKKLGHLVSETLKSGRWRSIPEAGQAIGERTEASKVSQT
jgi:hypothetical protein